MKEFDLIQRYFMRSPQNGDDAAVITPPPGFDLVTSTDTSIKGRHFPIETLPADIGYKSLAVSFSDMAAMGAEPTGILLNLSIPYIDEPWLEDFSRGFFELANEHNAPLVGGDTTQGPMVISTTVFGITPKNQALLRTGAQIHDDIYISGRLGDAAYALKQAAPNDALNRPKPRVALGIALRDIATSCIDISDGLTQDLGHILSESRVGAEINAQAIPRSQAVDLELAVCGGDDYELCFTVSAHHADLISRIAQDLELPLTKVGKVTSPNRLVFLDDHANPILINGEAFQHF